MKSEKQKKKEVRRREGRKRQLMELDAEKISHPLKKKENVRI